VNLPEIFKKLEENVEISIEESLFIVNAYLDIVEPEVSRFMEPTLQQGRTDCMNLIVSIIQTTNKVIPWFKNHPEFIV
jgi:hypothetical protein